MLKATGFVRRIDDLGRVVIPKEIRRINGINEGDPLEIYTEHDGQIVLKKYEAGCTLCGSTDDLIDLKDKRICKSCADKINKIILGA